MTGGCQPDQKYGRPRAFYPVCKHNRRDADGAHEHRDLARGINGAAALNHRGRQPACGHTAGIGEQINHHEWRSDPRQGQAMLALQETRNPEEIEPPDRIGEELPDGKRPGLPERKQGKPFDFSRQDLRIAANVIELRVGDTRVLLGFAINQNPEGKQNKSQCADTYKRPAPTPSCVDPRNYDRCQHGTYAGASIKYPGGQGAFFLRKPFSYRLNAGGKNCSFPEAQGDSRDSEA